MSAVTTKGYVIRKVSHSHFDEVVTILTADSLLSFYATGTRKLTSKNAFALQLGNLVSAEIFKSRLTSKLSKLKKASIIWQPPLFVSDTALVLMDILKLLQRISKSDITFFQMLVESFSYFGQDYNHHVKSYIYFQALRLMGISPNLKMCIVCGRTDKIRGFSFNDGGYSCNLHASAERSISFLRAVANIDRSFELYKNTEPAINQQLFSEIKIFIQANNYL